MTTERAPLPGDGAAASAADDDYLQGGRLTALGIAYLQRFKSFSLFTRPRTVLLFALSLPLAIPLALLRILALVVVFQGGGLLKKYLSFTLEDHPRLVSFIYFVGLGVYVRVKERPAGPPPGGQNLVIVANHFSRFDAMLLANLHQADATYRAAAPVSFFGRLIISSGLASRAMTEGLALDTKEGRDGWRQRLAAGGRRPLLFFPEGRVVQRPHTIMTFQNHLLVGQKVTVVCRKCRYNSFFLDQTQIELPFFKPPFSRLPNKLLWDSIIEGLPFLISLVTIFETEVLATVTLSGNETLAEIDAALYAPYLQDGFTLVEVDPALAKRLLQALYR